jgi:vitamin B12 transporter
MINLTLSRVAGWSLLASACAATPLATRAQAPVEQLDAYVVSATRTPQDPKLSSSSITLVPLADLQAEQTVDLRTALAQTPGVFVANSGAMGGQSSVFLRGANSDQTLFIVDGVRMNDRSTAYLNFLSGADLAGLQRVEVLRGPQSTLYGSSALGGVILLETARGCGTPTGVAEATAGSFSTYGGSLAGQGGTATSGFSGSLARTTTANDRPNNDYKQWSYSTRLESQVAPTWLLGATLRGQQGDYEEPGSRLYASAGQVDADNHLVTAYGQWRPDADLTSRLTVAWHQRQYSFADAYGLSRSQNTRDIADWQNTWVASPQVEVVAGANAEQSRYTIDSARTDDHSRAGYFSTTVKPIKALVLTGGLRYDNYASAGGATTGRAGVAWLPTDGTKLRVTSGTGFEAPGSDDRYGVPQWGQLPSPGLRPEKSRGWDAGVDQTLADDRGMLSATYFYNRFRDLFDYQITDFTTYQGRIVNRARATTQGAEFAAEVRVGQVAGVRASYTYLDALDDVSGARLQRRPRHAGDVDAHLQATKAWLVGAGLHVIADRVDSGGPLASWTTVRLYTSYAITSGLRLKLRVENALNQAYEEVYGYAALPRGVFGSVEWRF